jgi:Flp pilus assembly protein TadD
MRPMIRFLTYALLLCGTLPAWAGHIRGQVRMDNGKLVDRAVVLLRSDMVAYQTEVFTDAQGRFEFDGLPLTTFVVTIEFPGYYTYVSHIDISMSKMAYEDITLRRDRSKDEPVLPPEGAAGKVDARLAAISPEALQEFSQGRQRMDANDARGAIAHFQRATELYPRYAEAYQMMGAIYLEGQQFRSAEEAFSKATEIDGKSVNSQYGLGVSRNLQGNPSGAMTPLEQCVRLDPGNADTQFELAKSYFAVGDYPKAEVHARRAIVLRPGTPLEHLLLGYILLREKNGPGAIASFSQFLTMVPKGEAADDVRRTIHAIQEHEHVVNP